MIELLTAKVTITIDAPLWAWSFGVLVFGWVGMIFWRGIVATCNTRYRI